LEKINFFGSTLGLIFQVLKANSFLAFYQAGIHRSHFSAGVVPTIITLFPHKNRISAVLAEKSIMETVRELIEPRGLLESCFESAWERFQN